MITNAERIRPEQARAHLETDDGALLVCAYDDPEKFRQNHLEGAMSLADFRPREQSTPKEREIIFYCA